MSDKQTLAAGVGKRLREARESLGLSRAALSTKTGIREGTITKAESRASAPDSATLLRLARALNSDPWALTFGDATPQANAALETESRLTEGPQTEAIRLLRGEIAEVLSIARRAESVAEEARQLARHPGRKTA